LKKLYKRIFGFDNFRKPDFTIFLDVSPEIAYSRKQDYPYDQMVQVNKAYKEFMYVQQNVIIINADQDQEIIKKQVVNEIIEFDKRKSQQSN
jgi:thymidylate kinase